ncbi:MAG: S8/S53 family peptidase [Paludibacteraceae bacterium]
MKKLLLFLLCIPTLLTAQNKLSPYTNIFLQQQKEAQTETQKVALKNLYSITTNDENKELVSGFLFLKSGYGTDELENLGVLVNTDIDSLFTVSIPVSKIEEIVALDYVKRFEMGTPVFNTMNTARGKASVDEVHNGQGGLPQGYTGKNTVIGIVDIGLQYDHINFYTKDRSDLRVKRVWNQSATGTAATRPTGFTYGREYKTKASILAAKRDNTSETHGTHVAGIAAGSTTFNNYGGVAPDADIIMVSVNTNQNNAILDGIKYCFNSAEGKPCVVNVSWGSHIGPHDGTSAFDQALNAIVGEKKIVVGSAGNEGSDYIHSGKTMTDTDTILNTIIEPYNNYVMVDVWGDVAQNYQLQICIFDASGNELFTSKAIDATQTSSQNISLRNGGSGTIRCESELNPTNNKGNVYLYSQNAVIDADNYLGLKIIGKNGTINAWAQYGNFATKSIAGFTADNTISVGEIGGTAERIITVGSFNSSYGTIGKISNFSSLGPTADNRTKPDVLAPGCVIISSVNGYAVTTAADMADQSGWNFLKTETVNNVKYRYGKMQGTSMASPFMAGVVALWMENARFLTPEGVKEVLEKTATQDSYTGVTPNNSAGYGKVNALAGLIETFSFSSLEEIEKSNATLICYPNPVIDKLHVFFPKTDKNVTISVWNVNGQMVSSRYFEKVVNLQQETIDFSGISSGLYIVRISGNKTSETFKIQK